MRAIILAATLLSLSPMAVMAQTRYAPATPTAPGAPYIAPAEPTAPAETYGTPTNGSVPPQNTYGSMSTSTDDGAVANAPRNTRPDPDNCGTPYEPKACPPTPRRPLNYPENRQ